MYFKDNVSTDMEIYFSTMIYESRKISENTDQIISCIEGIKGNSNISD